MDPFNAHAALLVIDVQQGFSDPIWGPRNNPEAEANIGRLLAAWRETGRPVVHVHHDSSSPLGSFVPGRPGNAPKPEAVPLEGEPVHHKSVNSGFIGTRLEQDLRDAGIDTLAIVGLTTQHCVSTTTRMAGNLGFRSYVVADATATFDQIGLDGRKRPASDVHFGALSDLNHEFATIVETQTLLDAVLGRGTNG
jgi:nicotinamidase-related amidase